MSLISKTPGGWYKAHSATIVGEVTIGELCSFWFNAVVRGDVAAVKIGQRVNVQDRAVIHCDTGEENVIEDDVSIGHGAIVHGQFVGQGSLIGMGAMLLGHTRIGRQCLVAAGAVVPPGMQVPDGMVVMGVPARIVRPIRDEERKYLRWVPQRYVELAEQHIAGKFAEL